MDERRDARPRGLDRRTGASARRYLIALLDDATRVVPYAAFALSENTAAFLPVLRAGDPAPRDPQAALRRQRRRVPLAPPRAGLRQARHHAHPRPAVPAAGQGKAGALVSDGTHAAPADARRGRHREPRRAQSAAVGLGRGRVPPEPAPGPRRRRRRSTAGRCAPSDVRLVGPGAATSTSSFSSRRSARSSKDRTVSLARRRLRGRRRARRRDRHAALRSRAPRPARRRLASRAARSSRPARRRSTPTASSSATTPPRRSSPTAALDDPARRPVAARPRAARRTDMYRKHFGLTRIPSATRSSPTTSSRPPRPRSSRSASRTSSTCAASASSPATAAAARPAAPRKVLAAAPHRPLPRRLRLPLHRQRHGPLQDHRLGDGPARRAHPRRPLSADPNRGHAPRRRGPLPARSSSSTRRTTCAPTSSRICACSPTTRWTPRTGSACSSSARPSCGAGSPWPCTRRSPSASSSATTCPRSTRDEVAAYLAHRLRLAGTELAALRARRPRGALPGHRRPAAQDQPPRSPRAARRRARPRQDRHRRARPGRAPRGRVMDRTAAVRHPRPRPAYQQLPGTLRPRPPPGPPRRTRLLPARRPLSTSCTAPSSSPSRAEPFAATPPASSPYDACSYFAPVVEELIQEPPLPEYLDYLKNRLINAGCAPIHRDRPGSRRPRLPPLSLSLAAQPHPDGRIRDSRPRPVD